MKQEMNYMDFIERYLDGTMNNDELRWFQRELDGNTQLQADLRMQHKLKELIAEQKTISLQAQLDLIHNDLFKKSQPFFGNRLSIEKKKIIFISMAVAASCLIFFVVVKKPFFNSTDSNQIYSEYFKQSNIL
jgi:hypothetical protein